MRNCSITRKIVKGDVKSCNKNVSKIPDFSFIFPNLKINFLCWKKLKNLHEFWKINEFITSEKK